MITEIVTFSIPADATEEEVFQKFEMTAPVWRDNPDLIRKNYIFDAENRVAGGVYLWRDKADADKWHNDEFRQRVKEVYGSEPESQFFNTPIVVDNEAGAIVRSSVVEKQC